MDSTQRRYSKAEFAARGDAIYEGEIRQRLTGADDGKFLAIDIESAAYEVHEDECAAGEKLRARIPEAQIWMVRIGSHAVHRFGGHERSPAT